MELNNLLEDFEIFLKKNFQTTSYSNDFRKAIIYSILDGGKRLRPLIYISLWADLQKDLRSIFPFAAATECIHSYALVHDDMPCMDNDDYRRGKLSSHKQFGEANALLVGDALLTEAFSIILNHSHPFSSHKIIQAMQTIAYHAKIMLGGQFLDMNIPDHFENKQDSYHYLQKMEKQKTAYLFQSCLEIPAILLDLKEINILKEIGLVLGSSYQIKDDILDSNTERKTAAGKEPITYSSLLGVSKAKEILQQQKKELQKMLQTLSFETKNLQKVIDLALRL
jgi:geranylgeranyl diphosphate synthase type II